MATLETSRLDRTLTKGIRIDAEVLIFAAFMILAVITRFYDLESRVMSHDETTHVYFSWLLEQGRGYQHDPLSHGPLQFHLVALSYFLFGDTDATARAPAAVFGILAVGMMWLFRRWLGRIGALVAMGMMLFSPYMLYYSRYVRNEALVVPLALAMVWAVFRYIESRQARWLYVFTLSLSLHFATKETAFIYIAQLLLFLGGYLAWRLLRERWERRDLRGMFIFGSGAALIGIVVATVSYFRGRDADTVPEASSTLLSGSGLSPIVAIGILLAVIGVLIAGFALVRAYGRRLRTDFPALDIMIVSGILILPQFAALPANILGWDPLNYTEPSVIARTAATVAVLTLIGAAIGALWDWKRAAIAAAVFYVPFFVLYTTLFTNGGGVGTGLVGSLGYWLVQHGVERGSQPEYYYALIQLPFYEFLALAGVAIAGVIALRPSLSSINEARSEKTRFPVVLFLAYWSATSFLVYSFAGERMPWLTVHIALPLILLAGWGIGTFLKTIRWELFREYRAWLIVLLLFVGLLAGVRTLGHLLGPDLPFQGRELSQLNTTSAFISSLSVAIITGFAIAYLRRGIEMAELWNLAVVGGLVLLVLLSIRTAFRAAYIDYDNPTEFLVYAHSATGPKTALEQIEDLSVRTTGTLDIQIAYDNETTYPYWWYLRNYPNALYYGTSPSRDLLNYPIVAAGEANFAKIDPLMRDRYYQFEYMRLWWPMQDYFNLTWERIRNAVTNPELRAALWEIWLNRDYEDYGRITGKDFSLTNWDPAQRMKLYVRKDIAALIWDYGIAPVTFEPEIFVDPYEDKLLNLAADLILGGSGGQYSGPRGVAVAPNGEIYVADTKNHRLQRFSPSGVLISSWGTFADVAEGDAPGGTFNEPWGIAIAPDGSVYVADTWNHRIQRFSSEGEFIEMFGYFGQAEAPDAFWGPRDVVVDPEGRVFITDTGNKRVVIFAESGEYISEFGGFGLDLGQLDEPVGLALDASGRLFVVDTWNQRIQIFEEFGDGFFQSAQGWEIDGWFGQSLDNKPYLAVNQEGTVCTSDPEGYRILCFSGEGEFELGWGVFGSGDQELNIPAGLTFDQEGRLWVADSGNDRLMRFTLGASNIEEGDE
jgi:uncharacterized protein (TIGR03663 family)